MLPVVGANTADELLDRTMWWGIGLVLALLLLAWAAYRLRSWFGDDSGHTDGSEELLTHLEQLQSAGDVSDEEYRSIKGRLRQRREPPSPPTKE